MTGLNPTATQLASRATTRLQHTFRPATMASYIRKFKLFVAFCCFINVNLHHLTPLILLSFLEFLTVNQISPSNIANYISAIKTTLAMHGVSTIAFYDQRITLFQRSLRMTRQFTVKIKKIIDIDMLKDIVATCDSMWMGQIFKTLYLVAFFSFLCISNLVPHKIDAFSPLEQLTRGDVFFASPGLHVLVKWSKTMQTRDSVKILKLPFLSHSPLCPVTTVKNMLMLTPGHQDTPLFQIKNARVQWVPLTDTQTRRNFTQVLTRLGLQDSGMSLHIFRRSGASLAFNSNVSLQNIQSHGTWTSDCVWRYIVQDHNASQQVAEAFQALLSSTTS